MNNLNVDIQIMKVQCFELEKTFNKTIEVHTSEEDVGKKIEKVIDISLKSVDEEISVYLVMTKIEAKQLAQTLLLMCDEYLKD